MIRSDKLMTSAEVAAACGRSERTLWNWSVAGIGPQRRKADTGQVFYLRADVDEYSDRLLQSQAA